MKLLAVGRLVFGAVVVVAVLVGAIFALRPSRPAPRESAQAASTRAARTAFAPVTPLPPSITPLPTPAAGPRLLDVASGALSVIRLGPGFFFVHLMSDGSVLASDGAGNLQAVARDGSVLARVSGHGAPALSFSADDRYAMWVSADGLRTYDAVTRAEGRTLPAGATFPRQLADGSVILCGGQPCTASVLIAGDGTAVRSFGAAADSVAASADALTLAWAMPDGMHVFDRTSGMERTYPGVQWVAGGFALSADGSRLLYARLTGDNAVHIRLVDLKAGAERELYNAPRGARAEGLSFVDATRVRFTVTLDPARPEIPGTEYTVNDDGTQLRARPLARPWSTCGPACGLPSASDVGPGGVAFWCEAPATGQAGGGCRAHLVRVDRQAGTVRDLLVTGDPYSYAVSPDGATLAVAVSRATTIVHLIGIADGSERTVDIGATIPFASQIAWLPDGRALLLVGGGK
ncbi:MAG: hypothetical protein IVW36_08605 [Dehalococcoidia bacterium]|nr:hypothetical protein [Dehalococcoidia bacterium]